MRNQIIFWLDRVLPYLIGLGILGMIQPWLLELFRYGFLLLLASTLAFIVVSHLTPALTGPELEGK